MYVLDTSTNAQYDSIICHSEWSEAQSKDLRDVLANAQTRDTSTNAQYDSVRCFDCAQHDKRDVSTARGHDKTALKVTKKRGE